MTDGEPEAPVEIGLAGEFAVRLSGTAVPLKDIASRKARTLVKLLAVERGNRVGVDRISAVLWPDDPPRDPKGWLVTAAWHRFVDDARSQSARRVREDVVHGQPAPGPHGSMDHSAMKGHDMSAMGKMDMASMPLMPGMLTPQQMKVLAKSTGSTFDHLFLTGMIQHHTGALIMVEDLFDTPGAGQDSVLYDFATDIDNTQRAEIEIMKSMLKEKK